MTERTGPAGPNSAMTSRPPGRSTRARGYLRRVLDHADRRLTRLELSPRGKEFFRGLWLAAGKTVARAIAQFTPQDPQTLARLLNQIAGQLEHAHQAPGPGSGP